MHSYITAFSVVCGPVYADRISNCPLDRVLTYKNLIYLLNLQIYVLVEIVFRPIKDLTSIVFLRFGVTSI